MKKVILSLALSWNAILLAQDNLINAVAANQSKTAKEIFKFTNVINLNNTDVKNQGKSGTCWSYAVSSFLESEMMKAGVAPVDLAEIFTARQVYIEKAINYVRLHGGLTWGDGGELHDVINIYKKYGAVPQYAYTGLTNGATTNNFEEMQKELEGYLKELVKQKELPDNWLEVFINKMDSYLGKAPESFFYNGKFYTPKTFASEVIGLDKENYVELINYQDQPKYKNVLMLVPDNWSFDHAFNVEMEDFILSIDNALKNGYTVGWATDVSEKYFSWANGIAFVPEDSAMEKLKDNEKYLFSNYLKEQIITPEMRQKAFDNYQTTDDHGMHIVGLSKDQNGREYYLVKNSWGTGNDYQGYLLVTKNFVRYKTTALLLNEKALPKHLKKAYKKLKIK